MRNDNIEVGSNTDHSSGHRGAGKMMHFAMLICCAVMIAPLAILLLSGDSISSGGIASLAIPMAICVGAHFLMHRFMGASCHGSSNEEPAEQATAPVHSETVRRREGVS